MQCVLFEEYYGRLFGVAIEDVYLAGDDEDKDEGVGKGKTKSEDRKAVVESDKESNKDSNKDSHKDSSKDSSESDKVKVSAPENASDFIQVLPHFLMHKITLLPGKRLILLPSDRFHIWHTAVLNHAPLPFALGKPCHHDIIRVHPPSQDTAGHLIKPGIFNMALFLIDCSGLGLQCK
ncbi:hypothetical protein FRC06_011852 [Ceratobasidium sp. 370]|nr:hypothetical protein FRC06_011852 [Ceratobasidium sp. 370]